MSVVGPVSVMSTLNAADAGDESASVRMKTSGIAVRRSIRPKFGRHPANSQALPVVRRLRGGLSHPVLRDEGRRCWRRSHPPASEVDANGAVVLRPVLVA